MIKKKKSLAHIPLKHSGKIRLANELIEIAEEIRGAKNVYVNTGINIYEVIGFVLPTK